MRRFFTPTFLKAAYYQLIGKNKRVPGFILGSGRCGSSLLVDVLASNQQIDVRQQEWYRYFLKSLSRGFKGKEFLTDIIDFKRITNESLASWNALDRFYMKALFGYFANKNHQVVFLIKSPAISMMLSEIEKMFPNAKYIHLYRNGYAVVNSLYNKEYQRVARYRQSFSEQEFKILAAKYWVNSVNSIDDFLQLLDNKRKMSFSYEEFTAYPQEYLKEIADFLGVQNNFNYDISTIKSRNYKIADLSKDDLKAVEHILEQVQEKLGYETIDNNK